MTDDEQFDEPDFDDPAHAGIRDLLASARVDQPLPAEVAARLDATLAELTGRVAEAPEPNVVPLRRRSKVGPRLLAAAAVIVVAGAGAVGLNQVVQNTSSDDSKASPATAARDSGDRVQPEAAPPTPLPSQSGILDSVTDGYNLAKGAGTVPVLTTADFADRATILNLKNARLQSFSADLNEHGGALTRRTPSAAAPDTGTTGFGESAGDQGSLIPKADRDQMVRASARKAPACTAPKIDGTRSYPIVLDLAPAVLVVHPANAGIQLVEAWNCDGTKVLTFTTIPAK